jgi:hypothetical protein
MLPGLIDFAAAGLRQPVQPDEIEARLAVGRPVEDAHLQTLAWLRSRLPGYPMIPAPQLAPGTPWTSPQYTNRVPWRSGDLAAGMQYAARPPHVAQMLGVEGQVAAALDDAAAAVAAAVDQHPVVRRFGEAMDALDATDRALLRTARVDLRASLAAKLIDAHEPSAPLPRNEFRERVTAARVASLDGRARELADAFAGVDEFLERATSDVFGQLVLFGRPAEARLAPELIVRANASNGSSDPGWASVMVSGTRQPDRASDFPAPGMLLRLEDPLVQDVVRVVGISFSMGEVGGGSIELNAEVLPGTTAGWARTAYASF